MSLLEDLDNKYSNVIRHNDMISVYIGYKHNNKIDHNSNAFISILELEITVLYNF